jgi:membrane associated rhomboid family serine protease
MITYIILGLTIVVSFSAFNNPKQMQKLIMYPYAVKRNRQYFRFITSGFIHKDHLHLIFNMFSLYFFGTAVERVFQRVFAEKGNLYFILLYTLALVVSDLPSYLKNRDNPSYQSLGASGAVSAVIFAFILFQPLSDIFIYFALCMPGFILGTLYILFSYYQGKKGGDNINHDAHLYGALFGFVFCAVTEPSSIPAFIEQVKSWRFSL